MDDKFRELCQSEEKYERYQSLQRYISSFGGNYYLGCKELERSIGMIDDKTGFQYIGFPAITDEKILEFTLMADPRTDIPNHLLRELGLFRFKEFIDSYSPGGRVSDKVVLDVYAKEDDIHPSQQRIHLDEEHNRSRESFLLTLDDAYKGNHPKMEQDELREKAWLSEPQFEKAVAYLKSKDWIKAEGKSWQITGLGTDNAEEIRRDRENNGGMW